MFDIYLFILPFSTRPDLITEKIPQEQTYVHIFLVMCHLRIYGTPFGKKNLTVINLVFFFKNVVLLLKLRAINK